jgi:hypothetical protein
MTHLPMTVVLGLRLIAHMNSGLNSGPMPEDLGFLCFISQTDTFNTNGYHILAWIRLTLHEYRLAEVWSCGLCSLHAQEHGYTRVGIYRLQKLKRC